MTSPISASPVHGAAHLAPSTIARVPPGTGSHTVWVWSIIGAMAVSIIPVVWFSVEMPGAMIEFMRSLPVDGGSPDIERVLLAELKLALAPWYWFSMLIVWTIFGASVWFAAMDMRTLAQRGFVKPFHWAWIFLATPVYIIGRHVVIRQRGGQGAGPLIAMIATEIVLLFLNLLLSAFLMTRLVAELDPFVSSI